MEKLNHGDRIYHKKFKQYGVFYNNISNERAYVELTDEHGDKSYRHVDLKQLVKIEQ